MEADETSVLQYLIGLSLDTKGWAQSAAVMDRTTQQQHQKELERDKQSSASAAQYLGIQQQSTKEYEKEKIATDKLLENAKLRLVQEKLIQEQINTQVLRTKQLADEQKRTEASRGFNFGKGATAIGGSILSAVGGSQLSGLGMAFATGGSTAGFLALQNAISGVVSEIKHFVLNAGPLQQQMELFSALAKQNGKDAKEWVEELKKATRGLIDDDAMIKVANKVMMQNVGVMPDKLTELIGLTTRFARVQGMDATQAMETLNRAMLRGRYQMLAMQLGIEKTTVAEMRRAEKLPAHIRMQEQMNILIKGMSEQLARTNEPAETLSEAIRRLSVSTENMWEAIAAGISTEKGPGSFIGFLNEIAAWMEAHEATFQDIGENISLVLTTIGEEASAVWTALKTLAIPLDLVNTVVGFDVVKASLVGMAEAAVLVSSAFKEIEIHTQYLFDKIKMGDAAASLKLMTAELSNVDATTDKLFKLNEIMYPGVKKDRKDKPIPPPDDEEFLKKLAKLQVDIDKAALDLKTENLKIAIGKRKEINDQELEAGRITVEEQVDFNKRINDELMAVEIDKIKREAAFKKKDIEDSEIAVEEEQKKLIAINTQTELQILRVQESYRQKNLSEDKKAVDERMKMLKMMIDSTSKIQDTEATAEKVRLQKLSDAYDDFYEKGKVSIQDWVNYRKETNNVLMNMDLANIERDKQAQLKIIGASKSPKEERDQQAYDVEQKALADIAKIREDYRKKDETEEKKIEVDRLAAQQKAIDNELQIKATALTQAEKDVEESFSRQEVDADRYLDQKRALIREEQLSTIQAAAQRYATNKKTATSEIELIAAVQKANAEARQKNLDLDKQTAQVYIKDTTERYNREKELLQSEQKNVNLRSQATKDLIVSTEKYITQLEELAASNVISVGTPEWEQLVKAIQAAKGELQGFNNEIQKTSTSLIGSVDNFSSFLSQHTKAGSWRHEALASALGATSMAGRAISGFEAGAGQQFTPGSLASRNLAAAVGESFKDLFVSKDKEGKSVGTFGERLEKVNSVLKDSFQVISAGIQAFQTRGAIQGGLAGAGFGGSFGGMLGGALSALGPWGAVIGAGVGAVVGIFTGHAKAKVDAMADELTKSFTKITTALQLGSITLSEAIKQQETLRAKTVTDLSTSKEGRKQLKEILPQMDQKITQMLAQQKQTIKNLQDEMAILNSPEAFQSAVSSIEGIIAKYKEYAAAVTDTRLAQDYLNKSVEQYIASQQRDLTSAERAAIKDAIDLNDQLKARQDLLESTRQQEYDVLSAGVLTRQRTTAMTKGAQIAEIQKAADIQLKQMNQQIELSTYKVNAEKQIFSMATTRIDLERELLVLQKQQTDVEMKRLVALQVVTASLKTGTSVSDLNILIQNLANIPESSLQDLLNNQYAMQARQGFGEVNGQF